MKKIKNLFLITILFATFTVNAQVCDYTLDNYSHINCYGDSTGGIDITLLNPNPLATTFWWTGAGGFTSTSANISNLIAGNYVLHILNHVPGDTSTVLCYETDTIVLHETLMLDNNATLSASCDSLCNGYITINPFGGTPPYTYLWSNGQTTNPATNLCPGAYNLTITDVNYCTATNYYLISQSSTQHSYDTLSLNTGIVWNGMPLNVSGDYSVTLQNLVGCDSIVNLNLTVTTTGISDIANSKSNLVKITDMLGQETPYRRNTPLFYIYDDGTVEKRIVIE